MDSPCVEIFEEQKFHVIHVSPTKLYTQRKFPINRNKGHHTELRLCTEHDLLVI